jgi:ribosomal-protein-alanine N-acetyltransferase
MSGLAIEAATSHVEVLVQDGAGRALAHEVEEVGHGHTRRLTPIVERALAHAKVEPAELAWVAADLGPGSFTGVRVGLATAHGLALANGAQVLGATSLAALAFGTPAKRALVVPMVEAGRKDAYLGFFRADARGHIRLLAAPRVEPLAEAIASIREVLAIAGTAVVRAVGPGVARWREDLEHAFPGSTSEPHRFEGLSAHDLADAARSTAGPAAGLPRAGETPHPLYVRSAQAEETVRRKVTSAQPASVRPFSVSDIPEVVEIEKRVFSDPWPASFFRSELDQSLMFARVAERDGRLAGYSLTWLGGGAGHLGNIAVVEGERRRGVAHTLLEDLFREARRQAVEDISLEVRVSNFAAQALYRSHGFRLAGLRRGYYGDTGEDALIMKWIAPSSSRADRTER